MLLQRGVGAELLELQFMLGISGRPHRWRAVSQLQQD